MCSLYSVTTNVEALRQVVKAFDEHPSIGNFPPLPGIFPDCEAPIIRQSQIDELELARVRWGLPSSRRVVFEAAKKRVKSLRRRARRSIC